MNRISTLLTILLSAICQLSYGQFFVANSGHDQNPGTFDKPFKTIQRAANIMVGGDSCYIRQGIYREEILVLNNGEKANPIVFSPFNNDRVIIKGTEIVQVWKPYLNNIYKAYFPYSVSQLMVNDQLALEARYPNKSDNNLLSTADWANVISDSAGLVMFDKMDNKTNYWKGATCVVITGKKWVSNVGVIASSDSNSIICKNRSWQWGNNHNSNYTGKGKGYIIKHLNALDQENEWHWQNDTLYYYTTQNIDNLFFEARVRNLAFNLDGKSNIIINNLNIQNATIYLRESNDCIIENSTITYPVPFFIFSNSFGRMMLNKRDSIRFSINHWNGCGLSVSGSNNTIRNCYIAKSWGDGISIGGHNNHVINCLIEDCNWTGIDAAPISAIGTNHTVCFNTIRNSGRNAITHRDCSNSTITNNDMYYFGCITSDLGGTYTYNTSGERTEIAYNLIHDNLTNEQGIGVYLDNYTEGYNIHHNLIWNCEIAIKTNKPGTNHTIYNNTVWNCDYTQSTTGGTNQPDLSNVLVFNNLSNKEWTVGTDMRNNLLTNNAKFSNKSEFDFSLNNNSPAIDYGIEIQEYRATFTGNSPDAGAYEFNMEKWKAGSKIITPQESAKNSIQFLNSRQLSVTYYPEKHIIQLESENGISNSLSIIIFNSIGEIIINRTIGQTGNLLDFIEMTDYNPGIYLLSIQTNSFQKNYWFEKH